MLYSKINEEGKVVVVIAPEAMQIPWVYAVWDRDRREGKPFFTKVLKWTFHVYSRDHVYSSLPLAERKKNVIETYFKGVPPEYGHAPLESCKDVQIFIREYQRLTKTINERMLETLEETVNNERERIASLDMHTKVKIEIPYDITIPLDNIYQKRDDGTMKRVKGYKQAGVVEQEVLMYDTKSFADLLKSSFQLIEQYEKAKKEAIKERKALDNEFNGESWLERYYRMTKTIDG
jgi:hypothetical protein